MRILHRILAASTAASLAGLAIGAGPAGASASGVGSTLTKTTVLSVQLGQGGSLLNLNVLADTGNASIDPHSGVPSAVASLSPLSVSSSVLHLNAAVPALQTKAPGGPSDIAGQALNLSSLGIPAALASGSVQAAALHSDFATTAAHSSMSDAEIDNLTLAGGALLSISQLSSSLGAAAITADANGFRGVNVGTIKALDLGALLKGLGINPATLPVPTVSALLAQLGTAVPGLPAGVSLNNFVTQLNNSLTSLRATLNTSLTQVTGTVDSTTQSLLGSLGISAPTLTSTVSQVNTVIDQVQAQLVSVLTNGLAALDSAPLVVVQATQLGITTKAADTLANSAVGVSVAPLKVTVAGVTLPTLDATSVVSTVNSALATATGALNSLVGSLGLPANLLGISALDQAKSLTTSGGYVNAVAGLTGLTLKIAAIDPTAVTTALSKLTGPTVSSLLGGAVSQLSLPATNAMGAVNTLLGSLAPLTGGATVQIASLTSASTFTATPATTTVTHTNALPHTGRDGRFALIGMLLAALALAAVRWVRVSHTA